MEGIDLFLPEIKRFITSCHQTPIRNGWFWNCEEQEVYLRIGPRAIPGVPMEPFIQIANIRTQEEFQKKGHFTRFLGWLEQFDMPIYVENVHNPILEKYLLKIGFTRHPSEGFEYDFYRLKQ